MIIGYTYVVGDILHVGHLAYLRSAKALCDKLIVGVLTDAAVREEKPKPTMPFADRYALVAAIGCVDVAVGQETYSPLSNILEIKPDILIESSSHETKAYHEFQGRVVVLPYYPGVSSTEIKHRIHEED